MVYSKSLHVLMSLVTVFPMMGCAEIKARRSSKINYPPPGEMVQLSTHKLHVVRKGNEGPTVLFESGLDYFGHQSWQVVQDELSTEFQTISYDRAGYLWSERGDNPKTGEAIANELHEMLEILKVSKPYIVVGHSLAGLTLRSFISKYPEDISGIVLVDVSHPAQCDYIPRDLCEPRILPNWLISLGLFTGYVRSHYDELFGYPEFPTKQIANERAKALVHKWLPCYVEELRSVDAFAAEASQVSSFGDIPLIVLTGTNPNRGDFIKDAEVRDKFVKGILFLQRDLLNLSSNSQQLLVPQAGHFIQIDHPEAVISAVRNVSLLQSQNDNKRLNLDELMLAD